MKQTENGTVTYKCLYYVCQCKQLQPERVTVYAYGCLRSSTLHLDLDGFDFLGPYRQLELTCMAAF